MVETTFSFESEVYALEEKQNNLNSSAENIKVAHASDLIAHICDCDFQISATENLKQDNSLLKSFTDACVQKANNTFNATEFVSYLVAVSTDKKKVKKNTEIENFLATGGS